MKCENYKTKNHVIRILFYIIIFFPLLGENIISTAFGENVSKIFSIVSCCYIFVVTITRKKVAVSSFTLIAFLLAGLRIIILFLPPSSSEINGANNMITPYGLLAYSMLFLLIDQQMKNKIELHAIFKSLMIIMTISVFLNLFIDGNLNLANNMTVFKEAISTGYTNSRKWLFGHRNMIFIHHLIWIVFSFITYKLESRNYTKLYLFQIVFTMFIGIVSWNSTMMFTTFIVFILSLLKDKFLQNISINHYVITYLILEIGIVFLRIQDLFSFIIVGILHRNLSFTGRTGIWNYYINQFFNNSILNKLFGNYGITELSVNTHNMFLGLLSFTGIIGVSLYMYLIFSSAHQLNKSRSSNSKFISIVIFGFLINALTMEFYLQPLIALYIGFKINQINSLLE